MLYAPFIATDNCRPSPRQRKANRLAPLLFAAIATVGLLIKYLP